jgi:glycosyltransferase involved in cell wall biosynthesis
MHILWLASWYPDAYEPFNGDFIQRHAIAVAKIIPINLIHVVQVGEDTTTPYQEFKKNENNLTELIYSCKYKKTGIKLFDKLRYNLRYRDFYKKIIFAYEKQYGKPDLIHLHVPVKAGVTAVFAAKLWNVPLIISDHSSIYDLSRIDNFFTQSFYFRQQTKAVYTKAVAATNVSQVMANAVKKLLAVKNISVIHNCVDVNIFNYQPHDTKKFKWLHISNMVPLKNVEKIIKAFYELNKQTTNWELILIGGQPEHLKNLVIELQLTDKIKFSGEIKYEEVALQMQQSCALVMFSKNENFPCVIIEALCCGLPIVSSNVGGIAEAVNETNGILVEKENETELLNALQTMMNNYTAYNKTTIAENATLQYAEEVIGKQFVGLYQKTLANTQ